jgi:hypothetical protein
MSRNNSPIAIQTNSCSMPVSTSAVIGKPIALPITDPVSSWKCGKNYAEKIISHGMTGLFAISSLPQVAHEHRKASFV